MRHGLLNGARRLRCAALAAAALHAIACQEAPECLHCGDPDPAPALETMDGCGVFASARAASGGSGTSGDPFVRLQDAIDAAKGRKVCACAGQAFAEAVTLRAGIEVRGDYTCDGEWKRSAETKSAIEGPAGQIALTLTAEAGGATVQGFMISAASATEPGGSSIAVAVADIAAQLRQVDVLAGDGKRGADRERAELPAAAGGDAPRENEAGAPTAPCILSTPQGGQPGLRTCGQVDTRGGAGGPGGTRVDMDRDRRSGQQGANGKPMPGTMTVTTGNGGSFDELWRFVPAAHGVPGAIGAPGPGGQFGSLTLSGILGGNGEEGTSGEPGQGGGGGAGYFEELLCPSTAAEERHAGPSGGGGGAGGCGGNGGAGGKAGGSSIGIVSLGNRLAMIEVTAAVGNAGDGGNGARGQLGGRGGNGAPGGASTGYDRWSSSGMGGNGGSGGAGGPGGGGRGGYAFGIAYGECPTASGSAPGVTVRSLGNQGVGGRGGEDWRPNVQSSPGASGVRAECWCSATNAGCGE